METNKRRLLGVLYITKHLGDHQKDVAGMTLQERGALDALTTACYQRGGVLPFDLDELYRLAGAFTSRERKAVLSVLGRKFVQGPDGWTSALCDAEIERIQSVSQKRRAAAMERWDREKQRPEGDANAYANAMLSSKPSKPVNHNPVNQEHSSYISTTTAFKEPLSYISTTTALIEEPLLKEEALVVDVRLPKTEAARSAHIGAALDVHVPNAEGPSEAPPHPDGSAAPLSSEQQRVADWLEKRRNPNWGYGPSDEERQLEEARKRIRDGSLFASRVPI
jgi:uncharacterized protein YdaU (DUF1376 family)/rhodanese-related sulfurtransferase